MISEVEYFCTVDSSMQKAMYLKAKGDDPRPLVVSLHTWSGDYTQSCRDAAEFCAQENWNFIFPDFRGPDWTSDALGSDKVVSDISDAVTFAKESGPVDSDRVYLIGGSGGGHAALLLAGRRPDLWAAVSAWCPIVDIAAWFRQCDGTRYQGYADHIVQACNGNPSLDPEAAAEAKHRSPLTWLENASGIPVSIATGIHDGHTGSVPVSHAINGFNVLADDDAVICSEDIDFITANQEVPLSLKPDCGNLSLGTRQIHLLRQSAKVRLMIFEGGHDILTVAGLRWLAAQKRGAVPVWDIFADDGSASELGR